MTTRRRWLVGILLGAWGALLVGLAVWYAQEGFPTVREQSDLAAGRAALDAAVATLQAETAGAGLDVHVEDYQVTEGCRLSLAWRGTDLTQAILVSVPAGEEPALLAGLADRLPADWDAGYSQASGRLSADAGGFVTVVGVPEDPGQVRITVSTGCRAGTDPVGTGP